MKPLEKRSSSPKTMPKLTYPHLMWVFIVGGVAGYIVEMIFCLVVRGTIESRQGLLYGPFNQIYGFAAVLLTVLLRPLVDKSSLSIFIRGALLGGVYEFTCHFLQEVVFKTKSWDFSDQTFSFNGRTSLLFMAFWGILSVCYIKLLYPKICQGLSRIKLKRERFIVGLLTGLFIINMALSAAAVFRWNERQQDLPASNAIETWLDQHYPNDHMEVVYPNMRRISEK